MSEVKTTNFCVICGDYLGTDDYCVRCGVKVNYIFVEPTDEVKIVADQQKKIADLQARIAERQKKIDNLHKVISKQQLKIEHQRENIGTLLQLYTSGKRSKAHKKLREKYRALKARMEAA
jgi:septal ring factor EnvC (AmiA/AmiB activator)